MTEAERKGLAPHPVVLVCDNIRCAEPQNSLADLKGYPVQVIVYEAFYCLVGHARCHGCFRSLDASASSVAAELSS